MWLLQTNNHYSIDDKRLFIWAKETPGSQALKNVECWFLGVDKIIYIDHFIIRIYTKNDL